MQLQYNFKTFKKIVRNSKQKESTKCDLIFLHSNSKWLLEAHEMLKNLLHLLQTSLYMGGGQDV